MIIHHIQPRDIEVLKEMFGHTDAQGEHIPAWLSFLNDTAATRHYSEHMCDDLDERRAPPAPLSIC